MEKFPLMFGNQVTGSAGSASILIFPLRLNRCVSMNQMFWQFCKFVFFGTCAATIHFSILTLLVEILDVYPALATTVGFSIAAALSYALNRRFTFASSARHVAALPKFLTVALLGAAMNAGIVGWFETHTSIHYLASQICATVTVLLWNFAANALWTFRQAKNSLLMRSKRSVREFEQYRLERTPRAHFLRHWFNLADEGCEDVLCDSVGFRSFAGIDLGSERAPNATTLLKFRRLLEHRRLGDALMAHVKRLLNASGVKFDNGTIADAKITIQHLSRLKSDRSNAIRRCIRRRKTLSGISA